MDWKYCGWHIVIAFTLLKIEKSVRKEKDIVSLLLYELKQYSEFGGEITELSEMNASLT